MSQPAPASLDAEAIRRNTLAMLQGQAEALNGIFNRLAKQIEARPTIEEASPQLRLALKIQSQCRTTCQMILKLLDPNAAKKATAKTDPTAATAQNSTSTSYPNGKLN